MNKLAFLRGTALTFVAAAVFAGTAGWDDTATGFSFAQAVETPAIEITAADVRASNEKVAMAHAALREMWGEHFRELGDRFAVPRLVRYRGGAMSACGLMKPGNAGYCPADNTIYFDELFVASQAKNAAREIGTDGDMAAVGIIAHEMGHAVAIQLGYASRYTYQNESAADCLAGAFALQAERDGSLEEGDLDEAFFGMAAAADPTPRLTGDTRMDRRILRAAALMGHGTREQRTENFKRGFVGGAGACLDVFQSLT
jgi:predicted metalloprotease